MKNTNNILSIIIPVYNSESYLENLIEKFQNSMYHKLLEIICVDDGSTDNSLAILQKLEGTVSNLQVYHQENKGVSAARNAGLLKATGVYVYFVDSDDDINTLEFDKVLREVAKDAPDLAMFGLKDVFYYRNKTKIKNTYIEQKTYDQVAFFQNFGRLLNKHIMYSPCNKIYRNEIIQENQITFQEKYKLGEDMLFNLQYLHHVNKIIMYPQYVYLYRHNEMVKNSGSTLFHANEVTIFLDILQETNKLLSEKGAKVLNEVYVNTFIVRKLSALLNHAYAKNSPLSKEQKLNYIDRLYEKEIFSNAIDDKRVKMEEKSQKVLLSLHQRRKTKVIDMLYKVRNGLHF